MEGVHLDGVFALHKLNPRAPKRQQTFSDREKTRCSVCPFEIVLSLARTRTRERWRGAIITTLL